MKSKENTYFLGLTMAGAISAGAYTAGVIDVLLEALDRHNARYRAWKDADDRGDGDAPELADHPRHRVVLRVISGTSAGGVTAGLMVAGLIGARRQTAHPEGFEIGDKGDGSYTSPDGYGYSYEYTLKPLHEVWIEKLDLFRFEDRKKIGFLTTSDLKVTSDTEAGKPVISALNSEHIDDVARTAMEEITSTTLPYGFLAKDLDLFLTTTNLQGIPYEIGFSQSGGDASHAMSQHSAIRHFRLSDLGEVSFESPWLIEWKDAGMQLPLKAAGTINFEEVDSDWSAIRHAENWPKFKRASIATGAFPIGLAPRVISAEAKDFGPSKHAKPTGLYTGGAWPVDQFPTDATRPKAVLSKQPTGASDPINYVAVDGGVANNEPFEYARYTLRPARVPELDANGNPVPWGAGDKYLDPNPRDATTATRSVLMIDPFPEGPVYNPLGPEKAQATAAMIPAASLLFPALVNQARFKPDELLAATEPDVRSRYLLAPSRSKSPQEKEDLPDEMEAKGSHAIASGSFGGFGGFFDRAFRAHDYMLGQRNARSFLKGRLLLDRNHEVFGKLFAGLPDAPRVPGMVCVLQPGNDFYTRPFDLPTWPRMSQKRLRPILDQAEVRVRDVGGALLKYAEMGWFRRLVLGAVWGGLGPLFSGLESAVSGSLRSTVMAELIGRDQHHDFRTLAPANKTFSQADQRRVLVALAEAGRKPIPLALPAAEHAKARAKGERPRDLLHVILSADDDLPETRAHHIGLLKTFLKDPNIEGHLWKAPWRSDDDARYTLAALTPPMAWRHNVSALRDRIITLVR